MKYSYGPSVGAFVAQTPECMSMRYSLLILLTCLSFSSLTAQTTIGLVAHYAFDGNFEDATGNTSNTGQPVGTPVFTCGVRGQAILLDGANDQVRILSNAGVNNEFDTEDFTVSMYYKPVGLNGFQYLLAKQDTGCVNGREFYLRFAPLSETLNLVLGQDNDKRNSILAIVESQACWQHVVIKREGLRVSLYLNGEFVRDEGAASRVNIETDTPLYIGGGECIGGVETTFSGLIDEVRVYSRALEDDEIRELFFRPDRIITSDTIIFQGNSFDVELGPNCGENYVWTPGMDVSDPSAPNPTIFGANPGTFVYNLRIEDETSPCVAMDSIQVTVVDPNTLPCKPAMPKAFTPNRDRLNDDYGLSNPFAIPDLISLEIYDRWGAVVFRTSDPFTRWDGTMGGDPVNPGVFLWKVVYRCDGSELQDTGTVTVLK
jgi:gliding motility-associated-like protein